MTTVTASSLLPNVTRYEDARNQPKAPAEMGKSDFLALFTAQLKNQNPLDPVKNEAFVAQLAQFSQLEATINMQTSLKQMTDGLAGERMLSASSLIGKRVAVAEAPALLQAGEAVQWMLDLPQGASGLRLNIFDASGNVVREITDGAQLPGEKTITWDGLDAAGNPVPEGLYRLATQAVVNGKTSDVSARTLSTVRGVFSNNDDGALSVEVDGGKKVLLSEIRRIGR